MLALNWLLIAAGGARGAVTRHMVNSAVQRREVLFPVGIFAINAVGCRTIGIVAGLLSSGHLRLPMSGRLFQMVGVLGGFTTFSAYGLDTLTLLRGGHAGLAVATAVGQPIVGIAAPG
jgi:CrcB protein